MSSLQASSRCAPPQQDTERDALALLAHRVCAARLADYVAIPPEQTKEGRLACAAAKDADLLARCAAAPARPASEWQPEMRAFIDYLAQSSAADETEQLKLKLPLGAVAHDRKEAALDVRLAEHFGLSADGGGAPIWRNSAVACAHNFLPVLASLDIRVHAISLYPRRARLIGCCTRVPGFVKADCSYGAWRFVVSLYRDVDCEGGIMFVRRVVLAAPAHGAAAAAACAAEDVDIDLRRQATRATCRSLFLAFLLSGHTTTAAFVVDRFRHLSRVADEVVNAPGSGWSTNGARLAWDRSADDKPARLYWPLSAALMERSVACQRASDGVVVHLSTHDGVLFAGANEEDTCTPYVAYPSASAFGPDPDVPPAYSARISYATLVAMSKASAAKLGVVADGQPDGSDRNDSGDDASDDEGQNRDYDDDEDFNCRANMSRDRKWLVEHGFISPWVIACRAGYAARKYPLAILETAGPECHSSAAARDAYDAEIVRRINWVADLVARRHGPALGPPLSSSATNATSTATPAMRPLPPWLPIVRVPGASDAMTLLVPPTNALSTRRAVSTPTGSLTSR
jgi:hypothetical protein